MQRRTMDSAGAARSECRRTLVARLRSHRVLRAVIGVQAESARSHGGGCGGQQRALTAAAGGALASQQLLGRVLGTACSGVAAAAAAAALTGLLLGASPVHAATAIAPIPGSAPDIDTFENVPGQLTSEGMGGPPGPRLSELLKGANKVAIEGCTRKCVPTCIRGGDGAPGLGPVSLRREIVVFKSGFRSRSYCLTECAQVCALTINKAAAAAAAEAQAGGGAAGR